jgi:hypothetical protein
MTRSLVSGLTPPSASVARHHREILRRNAQRALLRIDVGCVQRVEVHAAVTFEQLGDATVAQVGRRFRFVNFCVEFRSRPANRDRPSWMKRHFASAVAPGARLVVAMAPALTIGFIVRSALSSTAITELNGSPVALTPISRAPARRRLPADQREHERLGNALDRKLVPGVADLVNGAVDADDAESEQVARHPAERRNVVGDDALIQRLVPLIRRSHGLGDRRSGDGKWPVDTASVAVISSTSTSAYIRYSQIPVATSIRGTK